MAKASCNCGQLSVVVVGEPMGVSVCHCYACQKRTGSAFGVQARYPLSAVTFNGSSRVYQRIGDDGAKIKFQFCPDCGATLWFTMDVMTDVVAIPLGNFAGENGSGFSLPTPSFSVYQARCYDWVRLDGIEEVFD